MDKNLAIYQTAEGAIELKADLQHETIWATQKEISKIFGVNTQAITKHLVNIYKEEELSKSATCSILEQVQKEGKRTIKRNIEHYNLDAVIAVGYRINSVLGTKFRKWATSTLREYISKGYVLNEKRFIESKNKFDELQTTISFIEEQSKKKLLLGQEGELLHLLTSYAKTLTLLEAFDNGKLLGIEGTKTDFTLTYDKCKNVTTELKRELTIRKEASDLFGNERGNIFEGIIKNIYQTYEGTELYPNLEEKAANLLYLIIKDHPFSDGNKRIASFLFIFFLDKTNSLYRNGGEKRINDNALVALALLIAESNPKEKDMLINIIKNLISK